MMHYSKGPNTEKEMTKEDLPFKDCLKSDSKFLWMHVKGGTKVHNVVDYAKNILEKGEHNTVVWSGHGGGVIRTVSCAEIFKRHFQLYQITRTSYIKKEEHWLPQKDGLEEIIVTRQIPSIHILQSLTKFDDNIQGVQEPNTKTEFWLPNNKNNKNCNNTSINPRSQNAPYFSKTYNKRKETGYKQHYHQQRQKRSLQTANAGAEVAPNVAGVEAASSGASTSRNQLDSSKSNMKKNHKQQSKKKNRMDNVKSDNQQNKNLDKKKGS